MSTTAFHDPTSALCRAPFGAIICGGQLTLRVFVSNEHAEAVLLRVWDGEERMLTPDGREPSASFAEAHGLPAKLPRELAAGCTVCTFTFAAGGKPGLLWYGFRIDTGRGRLYVGAGDEALRLGCVCSYGLPRDYRVTVYRPGFDTPEWFKRSIAYQIFPDRFAKGEYPGLEAGIAHHRGMGRRIYEKQWHELPDYTPRGGARFYSPSDFYFGNFQGIIDKIPYLESLNIGAVYLNPIFESPYNHRYSTCDHRRIDPLLGSEEDFSRMCAELKRHGIRVILDGVFSHTGDDSVYFDRYGNYGGGAYRDQASPYRRWYFFSNKYKCGYRSWWGFDTLPEVNELEPSYMEFAAGIAEKWIRLGASGWRLDVADELPDGFMRFLRGRIKAVDPEALLIGEVWEDASCKKGDADGDGTIKRRGYTDGDMLDGVMDYPFADAVLDFLTGRIEAPALRDALYSQLASYPEPFMRAQLGLIGSHDTMRALSVLSGAPLKDSLPREKQAEWRPAPGMAETGKARLRMAAALQFSMPFAPCIYYGDEAGLEGLSDPFCRKPYPWGSEDGRLLSYYRGLTMLRSSTEAFISGGTAFAAPDADSFAILRQAGAEAALTVVSRRPGAVTLSEGDFIGDIRAELGGEWRVVFTGDGGESSWAEPGRGGLGIVMPRSRTAVLKRVSCDKSEN